MGEPIEVRITFGRSRSSAYGSAVNLARELPGYERLEVEGRELHRVEMDVRLEDQLWPRAQQLATMVRSWRGAKVSCSGNAPWDYPAIVNCLHDKIARGSSPALCSPSPQPLGCTELRGEHGPSSRPPPWWTVGEFLSLDRWRVNREEIWRRLRADNATAPCTACPIFSWERVKTCVFALPEELPVGHRAQQWMPDGKGRVRPYTIVDADRLAMERRDQQRREARAAAHAVVDGSCSICQRSGAALAEPCGRPELGLLGMIELE